MSPDEEARDLQRLVGGLAVALGFGILMLSQVPANAALGVLTVVSLLACLAATLLVIPALLRVTGRAHGAKESGGGRAPRPPPSRSSPQTVSSASERS